MDEDGECDVMAGDGGGVWWEKAGCILICRESKILGFVVTSDVLVKPVQLFYQIYIATRVKPVQLFILDF